MKSNELNVKKELKLTGTYFQTCLMTFTINRNASMEKINKMRVLPSK